TEALILHGLAQVLALALREVVDGDYAMPTRQQSVAKMGTQEPGCTGHHDWFGVSDFGFRQQRGFPPATSRESGQKLCHHRKRKVAALTRRVPAPTGFQPRAGLSRVRYQQWCSSHREASQSTRFRRAR